jgi:hypothetical protein
LPTVIAYISGLNPEPLLSKEFKLAHWAHVKDGIVDNVIVIEKEVLDLGHWGDPAEWFQTSYNTSGGKHLLGGVPLRKNYAGLGFSYDAQRDAFIPPSPFPSWVLDEETCLWNAPTPMPVEEGKMFVWDEPTTSWVEFVPPVVETPAAE